MTLRQQRKKRQRGGAFVEFAFAMTVLAPLVIGTFGIGLALRDYNALQTAVRNGARFASLQDYESDSAIPTTQYIERVRNLVVYTNPNGTGSPVVSNITPANVQVTVRMRLGVPYEVTVAITGYTLVDFFRTITLNGSPSCTFPYMGRYAPPA